MGAVLYYQFKQKHCTGKASASAKMSTFKGRCHCQHHQWEVTLTPDQSSHILCHCDTCKILGGGAYTMNQIIPKSNLKITQGGEPACYTYKGDSGKSVNCYYCPKCTTHIYHHQEVMGPDTIIARTACSQKVGRSSMSALRFTGRPRCPGSQRSPRPSRPFPPHSGSPVRLEGALGSVEDFK